MKLHLSILIGLFALKAVFSAEDDIVDRLSQAYRTNNLLVSEKSPLEAEKSICILTKNCIEQVRHIKHIADRRLKMHLMQKDIASETERNLLYQHIWDLYSERSFTEIDKGVQNPCKYSEIQDRNLIWKILGVYNRSAENPEVVKTLNGTVTPMVLNIWYNSAVKYNRNRLVLQFPSYKIGHICSKKDMSDSEKLYFVFGEEVHEGGILVAKVFQFRMETRFGGRFVSEISESDNIEIIKRLSKIYE